MVSQIRNKHDDLLNAAMTNRSFLKYVNIKNANPLSKLQSIIFRYYASLSQGFGRFFD